ncbi:hypothetical protein TNCV_2822741 [Trichonephila clavipes]|nr:hypothetical protein TNCV_2822741 [Trichonephila clavipes]
MVDPSVFVNKVEVTPRIPIPPLITRCNKGTQTISPYLHVKHLDLGKSLLEQQQANKILCPIKQEPLENPVPKNIVLLVPSYPPLMKLGNNEFIIQPTIAIWNVHAKPKLYSLAYEAWRRHGPQDLTSWTELVQAVLDGCYGQK